MRTALADIRHVLTWDEAKRAANIVKHGIDFAQAEHFDWASAVVDVDDRVDYGEKREYALGLMDGRLHVLIFTRRGADTRIISLRKANNREELFYAEARKA